MSLVMLKPGWPGERFTRSLYQIVPAKKDGQKPTKKFLRTVTFVPQEPQDLKGDELQSILPDIGRALVPALIDGTGRVRVDEAALQKVLGIPPASDVKPEAEKTEEEKPPESNSQEGAENPPPVEAGAATQEPAEQETRKKK